MKRNTFLPVMSVVLILCSAMGIVQALFLFLMSVAVSRTATVEAATIEYDITLLFLLGSILRILCSTLEMTAGIKGIIATYNPYKAASCIKFGIAILVLKLIVGLVFLITVACDVAVLPFVILSAVFPTLYICSARQRATIDTPRL